MSESSGPNINTFTWVTGIIGLCTVVPLLCALVKSQLPSSKLENFERALDETRDLLHSVVEKGLLSDERFIADSKQRLDNIEDRADDLKMTAYSATTTFQELKGMLSGLSFGLHKLCRQVHKVRTEIAKTTSSEARKRMHAEPQCSVSQDQQAAPPTAPSEETKQDDLKEESGEDSHSDLGITFCEDAGMSYGQHGYPIHAMGYLADEK